MKLVIQTILGILALIAGISLLYLLISGLNNGVNYIFLILSLVFIGGGGFLFVRVSKLANADTVQGMDKTLTESGSKLLQKNNQIISDYSDTNVKKDHL